MPCQLVTDCLNEIFEYLDDDDTIGSHIYSLHSCLLVNHLWCEASVRILWRNVFVIPRPQLKILGTLIACLPNESKELLYRNEIFIPTPTSKPPLFNYVSFCKVLHISAISYEIKEAVNSEQNQKSSLDLKSRTHLVMQEVFKM